MVPSQNVVPYLPLAPRFIGVHWKVNRTPQRKGFRKCAVEFRQTLLHLHV